MAALGWLLNLGFAGGTAGAVVVPGIQSVAAQQAFSPGIEAGQSFKAGAEANQAFAAGANAAQVVK